MRLNYVDEGAVATAPAGPRRIKLNYADEPGFTTTTLSQAAPLPQSEMFRRLDEYHSGRDDLAMDEVMGLALRRQQLVQAPQRPRVTDSPGIDDHDAEIKALDSRIDKLLTVVRKPVKRQDVDEQARRMVVARQIMDAGPRKEGTLGEFAGDVGRAVSRGALNTTMNVSAIAARIESALGIPIEKIGGASADEILRMKQDYNAIRDMAEQESVLPPKAAGYIQGATESLTTAIPAAASGNPYLVAGVFGLQEGNEAITRGRDMGLTGGKLAAYAATEGAIEAGVSAFFTKIGKGGLESQLAGKNAAMSFSEALRSAAKVAGQELPEEVITEAGHVAAKKLSGVDPEKLTWKEAGQVFADTVAQTVLTVGAANVPSMVKAGARVWRADELLRPDGAARYLEANPDGARVLALKENPSQKDFEEAGLSKRGFTKDQRATFVGNLREALTAPAAAPRASRDERRGAVEEGLHVPSEMESQIEKVQALSAELGRRPTKAEVKNSLGLESREEAGRLVKLAFPEDAVPVEQDAAPPVVEPEPDEEMRPSEAAAIRATLRGLGYEDSAIKGMSNRELRQAIDAAMAEAAGQSSSSVVEPTAPDKPTVPPAKPQAPPAKATPRVKAAEVKPKVVVKATSTQVAAVPLVKSAEPTASDDLSTLSYNELVARARAAKVKWVGLKRVGIENLVRKAEAAVREGKAGTTAPTVPTKEVSSTSPLRRFTAEEAVSMSPEE
jgi:hypothetical protein